MIFNERFSATFSYNKGTTACNGDSGGSLTFKENGVYRIRGIVSLTQVRPDDHSGFCKTDQYVVFTDVAKYLYWIKGIVSDLPSSSGNCLFQIHSCGFFENTLSHLFQFRSFSVSISFEFMLGAIFSKNFEKEMWSKISITF